MEVQSSGKLLIIMYTKQLWTYALLCRQKQTNFQWSIKILAGMTLEGVLMLQENIFLVTIP